MATVNLSPLFNGWQGFTSGGLPLAGGFINTYQAGTNTPLATYTTNAGNIANANPIQLGPDGRPPFEIWLIQGQAYKLVLTDSLGLNPLTYDNISGIGDLTNISDSTNAANGAGLVGYSGSLNYVGLTVGARLLDIGASPRSFGGVGDGVADDTTAIQACLTYSKTLDLRNRSWKWTSPIVIPNGPVSIDARGATLLPATGASAAITQSGAKEGLLIVGGLWTPTTGTFIVQCSGTTNQPTTASQYARQLRFVDMHVTSATVTGFLDLQLASRQVYIDRCMVFTPNGINASGKHVEVMVSNSIIYSATGAVGTYGFKLRSTGGTTYYNEGWSIVNCTVDNFEISHDVTDVFVYQIASGYHACNSALAATTGYVAQFQAPSTNQCEEITIGAGVVLGARIRFVGSGAGQTYNARISDFIMSGVPGTAIAIENNAAGIDVANGKFKAGTGTAIGVVGTNNNDSIRCTNLDFDSTYQNGVVLNGATGANCVIGPVSGPTIGGLVGAGRSNILYRGVSMQTAPVAGLNRTMSAANLGGGATYIVGATISSIAVQFAMGETGDLIAHLPYSGANAATQNLQFTVPAGMVLASGTGWSAANVYPGAAGGLVSVRIPYYCTADGSGNVVLANQAGNTLTVINQGYCGIIRNW